MAAESEESDGSQEPPEVHSTPHNEINPDEEDVEAGDSDESEEVDEENDEDEEPKLKYARMTGHLGPVYRNGDATSAFLVAGDKMVTFKADEISKSALMLLSLLAHIMETYM